MLQMLIDLQNSFTKTIPEETCHVHMQCVATIYLVKADHIKMLAM